MIRIDKPADAPNPLSTRGLAYREAHCRAFDADSRAYQTGTKIFDFDGSIYGSRQLKEALITCQYGKCAFCESKITHIAYGDVEHFRPKGGIRQTPQDPLEQPGYYWLAYDWNNLFLSCSLCNQRFKKNLFPLANPRQRARSHHDSIEIEQPLVIDPANEDPEEFIGFHMEAAYPINENEKGKQTIEVLGLNRPAMINVRQEHYRKLEIIFRLALKQPATPQAEEARSFLERSCEKDEQYSSMVKCALARNFDI